MKILKDLVVTIIQSENPTNKVFNEKIHGDELYTNIRINNEATAYYSIVRFPYNSNFIILKIGRKKDNTKKAIIIDNYTGIKEITNIIKK